MGNSPKKHPKNQWLNEDGTSKRIRMRRALGDWQAEKVVRSVAFSLGYRYRLWGRGLPGEPHLVFPMHQTAIFVLSCQSYSHHGLDGSWIRPGVRLRRVWELQAFQDVLQRRGWRVEIIWACETESRDAIARRLADLMPAKPTGKPADAQVTAPPDHTALDAILGATEASGGPQRP